MFNWLFGSPLPVGTPAPGFSLPDQAGRTHKLSALRGRNVVLVFYPGDDTPVCRRQLCEFRDRWDAAAAHHATVLGVNPGGPESHARFREKYHFPFPLLVDKDQKVAGLYKASGLFVNRTVYLIGPDGVIRYSRRGKPSPDEVFAAAK
jgi:peroxiredoxin Q/BCP